jgi:hypothetical protein
MKEYYVVYTVRGRERFTANIKLDKKVMLNIVDTDVDTLRESIMDKLADYQCKIWSAIVNFGKANANDGYNCNGAFKLNIATGNITK